MSLGISLGPALPSMRRRGGAGWSLPGHLLLIIAVVALALLAAPVDAAKTVRHFSVKDEQRMRARQNTQYFRSQSYILMRRGIDVVFSVLLDAPLDEEQSLSLYIAPASILDPSSLQVTQINNAHYEISATLDTNAPVGVCSVSVRLTDQTSLYPLPRQVAVLFNPWHPDDTTHYPNTKELAEYINNEHGITYRGTNRNLQSVRWYFGQFGHEALITVLHHINKLSVDARRDPNSVMRFLTAAMTPQATNPDGILVGRWETTYPGGMNPSSWQGSDQVLRTYVSQGFNGVRYGQCWVYAAVLATLGRTIGVPMRVVSNFDSAHETPVGPGMYNQEILRYWDARSRRMVAEVGMIWNFHAWSEGWFFNRAAADPYGGSQWNVLDGTPQELSGDRYQLGPTSVRAVRDGRKDLAFDTSFVLSEVSSRIHNYRVACPFIPWGKLKQLPPGCVIIADMGVEARIPTGTFLVTKLPGIGQYGVNTITQTYHTRGGWTANAGPVFSSGGGGFRTFGSSGAIVTGAAEALDEDLNALLFAFEGTGLAVSLTMPPVALGAPIELWANFACRGRTADFDSSMRSRDRARRFYTLDEPVDEEESDGKDSCPEEVTLSVHISLGFTDYTGADRGHIGDETVTVTLHPRNGHFDSLRFEASEYLTRAAAKAVLPVDEYVRATVMATTVAPGSSPEEEEAAAFDDDALTLVATSSMAFVMPKLTVEANQTVVLTEKRRTRAVVDLTGDAEGLRAIVLAASAPGEGDELELEFAADVVPEGGVTVSTLSSSTSRPRLPARFASIAAAAAHAPTHAGEPTAAALLALADAEAATADPLAPSSAGVAVTVTVNNDLEIPLTNLVLRLSADGLGFPDEVVDLPDVPAGEAVAFKHEFSAEGAEPGPHYYRALVTSRELPPLSGDLAFVVDPAAFAHEHAEDLERSAAAAATEAERVARGSTAPYSGAAGLPAPAA